jgi:CRP-like cAMP-binding protein
MEDRERVARLPWFASLAEPMRTALTARGRLRRRAAGEWLHGEGDQDTGIVAVLDGVLHVYAQASGGREVLFGMLPPGSVMGQSVVFGGGPRLVTAVCATDALLFLLPDTALRQTASDFPALHASFDGLVYGQLRTMAQVIADLVALRPRMRLISRLLAFADADALVQASQGALAEMIGVSRKAVNGWLAELQRAGKVRLGYGFIELLDREGLAQLLATRD